MRPDETIIASFATIPTRISHIEPVIQSLLQQTVVPDEIHIQAPLFCKRTNSGYEIPGFLNDYVPKVKLNRPEGDFGGINKTYYPLKEFKGRSDVLLFVVDDDCVYQPESIEKLYKKAKRQEAAFCFSGGVLPRIPQFFETISVSHSPLPNTYTLLSDNQLDVEVDVLQGFGMYVLKPEWFDDFNLDSFVADASASYNEDMIIAGMLESKGIKRIQVGPYCLPSVLQHAEIDAQHGNGRLLRITQATLEMMHERSSVWLDVQNRVQKKAWLRQLWRRLKRKLLGIETSRRIS